MKPLQFIWRAFYGPVWCRWLKPCLDVVFGRRFNLEDLSCIEDEEAFLGTLNRLKTAYGDFGASEEEPIFILSAGWRSGSTLLQRIVMSNPSVMIWGEPYTDARPVQHLSRVFSCFPPEFPYRETLMPAAGFDGELDQSWVACLFPEPAHLHKANCQFMETWLKKPAEQQGRSRWGLKEVRLDGIHAQFLKWLYPKAKFLFLVRSPDASWLSYKGKNWYLEWPALQVRTCTEFWIMWVHQIRTFRSFVERESGLIIRYEDLVGNNAKDKVSEISRYLGIELSPSPLEVNQRGFGKDADQLNIVERVLLYRIAGRQMREMEYRQTGNHPRT